LFVKREKTLRSATLKLNVQAIIERGEIENLRIDK
jgi:hypothetical protein